jgi:DNA-binding GntR family transcriptional regulator
MNEIRPEPASDPGQEPVHRFEEIEKESTRQKVYKALRSAILSGKLKTGQRLAEIPLASQFGVSRAIVREALQELSHHGLVELNSYRGARVVHLSLEEIDEILGVRILLETEVVRLTRARIDDAGRARLRAMAEELNRLRHETEAFPERDLALHRLIWDLSGNRTMAKLLLQAATPLFAMSTVMRTIRLRSSGMEQEIRRGDHTDLVEAICSGTEEQAVEAMRHHLTENWLKFREELGRFLQQQLSEK